MHKYGDGSRLIRFVTIRHRLQLLLLVVAVLAACGGSGGSGIDSPCDLADAEMVESVFGGTVAEGVEGDLGNCEFAIEGGSVFSATVFDYGSADGWESTRQGYVDNRGGVTDVDAIGDGAFFPNNTGARELVVEAGGQVFAVTAFIGLAEPTAEVTNGVADLANAIAEDLG